MDQDGVTAVPEASPIPMMYTKVIEVHKPVKVMRKARRLEVVSGYCITLMVNEGGIKMVLDLL